MTERTKREKPREQDWLGFLFCILGGFATVSIALSWAGWESKGTILTVPVEELLVLVGGTAALVLSAGAAVLGSLFFLRPEPMPTWRLFGALVAGALGLALVAGAFGWGGELGAVFPGLLSGFAGRMLGAVLGVVVLWVALVLAAPRRSRSGVDAVQRVGLSPRADFAGVSAAESALLVTDPNPRTARPAAPAAAVAPAPVRREVTPLRQETLRPQPPARAAEPMAVRSAESSAALVQPVADADTPPAPAWEAEAPAEELEETLDELEEALDDEEVEEGEEEQADEAPLAGEVPLAPSWEQVGLFDEEEAVEEPPVPQATLARAARAPDARVEVAAGAAAETSEDPFAGPSPLELAAEDEDDEDDEEELDEEAEDGDDLDEDEEASAESKPEPEFVLAPRHAAAASAPEARKAEARAAAPRSPEPRVEGEGDERWRQLVFDAGCLVLEQNRVAVSMLERRFGIDFDQACGLLDELQQAGLIGPYMGGRTRDILLSRDEWLAHAPHAS